ncbi:MAG: HIT domain-containing protein [Thermodesulfobacteriota bacterium]
MERLWAPWRIEYILEDKNGDCVFCVAGKTEGETDDGLLLFSSTLSTVLLNKYPYNNGHLLISPKRHVADLEKLSGEELADLTKLIVHSTAAIKKTLNAEGFNVGLNLGKAGGAGIGDHLHWHVVPRWTGDANFMPVLSETKVLPEHLSETRAKLKPCFEEKEEGKEKIGSKESGV